jgi:hypothetical protein
MQNLPTDSLGRSPDCETTSQRMSEAKRGAARLLGCYRAGDANDPEIYVAAVISVLVRYPVEIIREVTEPATGLPGKSNWLPTVAEVRNECEVLDARERRKVERERQIAEQLQARTQITDQRPRPTYEELQRRCAEVGLMIGPKGSRLPPVDPAEIMKKHGISKEQWDAMPDKGWTFNRGLGQWVKPGDVA